MVWTQKRVMMMKSMIMYDWKKSGSSIYSIIYQRFYKVFIILFWLNLKAYPIELQVIDDVIVISIIVLFTIVLWCRRYVINYKLHNVIT